MNDKNNLKQNLIYNLLYQISILILPFISAPYISRVIGAEGLGIYSYYNSIALYFVYFAMLGIANYANRLISKNSDNNSKLKIIFSSVYFFQLITSFLVLLVYLIFVLFIVKENKSIPAIMLFHIISAMFDVSWLFFGLQEFKISSLRQIIIRIIAFVSIFVFVKTRDDLWKYTMIMSLSYFFSAFSLWALMWKKVSLKKCSFKRIISHIKPCIILFIPIIASSVYRLMDKIMIGHFCDMSNVGYYENAEKLIFISSGILGGICTVVMPKITNLIAKKREKNARELFSLSVIFCMMLGFAIAFGIANVSKEFIPAFFGNEFVNSINISILLCVSVPFMVWSMIIRNLYLIPYELDRIYVKSVIIGAIVNFITNLILIPIIGVHGAAIGTIVADIFLAIYQTYPLRNSISLKLFFKFIFINIISGIIMSLVIILLKRIIYSTLLCLILEIVIGGTIYILINMLLLKKYSNYSISYIRQILKY